MSESAWVIEARWQPPHYIHFQIMGHLTRPEWTDDHNKALRFSREQDAQAFLYFLIELDRHLPGRTIVHGPGPMPVVTEHVWVEEEAK